MKRLLVILGLVAFVGCQQQSVVKEDKVSKKQLATPSVLNYLNNNQNKNLPKVEYANTQPIPGKVKPFKQAFLGAPPMIPHSVKGMVPIKAGNNMCLNCHIPQNAKMMKVTPMPNDHMNKNRVDGRHYNCTLCHEPQAKVNPMIENKFQGLMK